MAEIEAPDSTPVSRWPVGVAVAAAVALMAGGQIAGFVGVLLALPVAAVIRVFARHAVQHYRSTDLYGGE